MQFLVLAPSALCVLAFALAAAPTQAPQEPAGAPEAPASVEAQEAEKRRLAAAAEEQDFFRRCDQNSNGWISLREGQDTLGLDASMFRAYDTDQDGRISRAEFGARYRLAVERVGAFRPPSPVPPPKRAPTRNAEQLRNAYDKNGDSGLAPAEVRLLLEDYERTELPAELAVEKLDRDGSTRIDGPELEVLARLLATRASPAAADPNAPKVKLSLEELFGTPRDRSAGFQTAPMPPQIDGPVPYFRRLDLDGSGRISVLDLSRLQAPLQLSVRAPAVLAALDADGDGELSPEELSASLGER